MKINIKVKTEVEIKTLQVSVGVRYWEDATVNGIEDEQGDLIPCRVGDYWRPKIDIETGQILNWKQGITANIHYKVCDDGTYWLRDENDKDIIKSEGDYVPSILAIDDSGFGDYIIIAVDKKGFINNWKFDISDFIDED